MHRSMLAFAISTAVVLTTETSYARNQADRGRKAVPADRGGSTSVMRATPATRKPAPATRRPAPPPSAVQQALRRDPLLAAMVSGRLPAGTNLMMLAAGFGDVRQFVGAVNAAKNLGIPFHHLKRRMVYDGMSLGLAIQDMLPRSDYRSAARLAENEAAAIINH
jgi:hypothetical protein